MLSSLHLLLADADISSVPADFLKNFLIVAMAIFGMWLADHKGAQVKGSRSDPLNVAQPLEVKQSRQYADKNSTETQVSELKRMLEAFQREMLAQHLAAVDAGRSRVDALRDSMHAQGDQLYQRLEGKLDEETNQIYNRINLQGEAIARIEGMMKSKNSKL